jgi:hypothetical protein
VSCELSETDLRGDRQEPWSPPKSKKKKYGYIYLTDPLPILWCCGDVEDVKTNERERERERERESESVESVH